jgi:hypothetical protein
MRQASNLYLREDVILRRVFTQLRTLTSRDTGIQGEITKLRQNGNPAELTRFLRTPRHHDRMPCEWGRAHAGSR